MFKCSKVFEGNNSKENIYPKIIHKRKTNLILTNNSDIKNYASIWLKVFDSLRDF